MRREWELEDLIECWTLADADRRLLGNKTGATRLGFALTLKFFELEARFPRHAGELPEAAVGYVSEQVKVPAGELASYDWSGRSVKYHRAQVRETFGFREATRADEEALASWLAVEVCPVELNDGRIREALLARCRAERIEPPGRVARIVGAARADFERRFCERAARRRAAHPLRLPRPDGRLRRTVDRPVEGRSVRHHRLRPWIWLVGLLAPIWLLTPMLPAREASAHPLNEYVQNTYIDPAPDRTSLELNLTPGVLVAPQIVALIDADGDGEISEAEGDAYANDHVLRDVALEVDGKPRPLTLVDGSYPTPLDMKAGLGTIRLHVVAEGPADTPGEHQLYYRNYHQPVKSKYLVNAFKKSGEVEIAQQDRDELQHSVRVDYTLTPGPSATSGGAATSKKDDGEDVGAAGGVSDRTRWLAGYLYEPASSPWLLFVGLGLSALLGGLHALTPGHGKTLAAAYLIGSHGTMRHAAALGGIVTLTHTASVIAVGLLALVAGRYILPDVLVPALEVGAGLLVVALGARLVRARWRKRGDHHEHGHHHHDHGHDHHHHVPPASVRSGDLLAMGVSGGLVPCPEALGVMLIAVGLDRVGLGLALIVAFSLGLAAVLIAIGVLLVRCKSRLDLLGKPGSLWQRLLPLSSAVIVTVLGVGIVLKGLMSYVS